METILFFVIFVSWIWSIIRGMDVSIFCVVLNFLFPPISQVVFAIYEERMRPPSYLMGASFGLMLLIMG